MAGGGSGCVRYAKREKTCLAETSNQLGAGIVAKCTNVIRSVHGLFDQATQLGAGGVAECTCVTGSVHALFGWGISVEEECCAHRQKIYASEGAMGKRDWRW